MAYKTATVSPGELAFGDSFLLNSVDGPIQRTDYIPKPITGNFGVVYRVANDYVYFNTMNREGKSEGNAFFRTGHIKKLNKLTGSIKNKFKALIVQEELKNSFYNLSRITLNTGNDPEIFVVDENNQMIPAFLFLSEKKDVTEIYQRAYIDGFQAEFRTKPQKCHAWAVDQIQYGLKAVLSAAKTFNPKAKLSLQNVFEMKEPQLVTAPYKHVELGCMPSKNVYNDSGAKVTDPYKLMYRFAGGHIHFEFFSRDRNIGNIIRALDAISGVAGVCLASNIDNPIRRKYYGLAGEYRTPPYGIEYRVLSNYWLCHPAIANLTLDLAREAVSLGASQYLSILSGSEEEVREIINTCNVKKATKFISKNEGVFKALLKRYYSHDDLVEKAFNCILNGVESVIKDPTDFVNNWNLDGVWRDHAEGPNCFFSRV